MAKFLDRLYQRASDGMQHIVPIQETLFDRNGTIECSFNSYFHGILPDPSVLYIGISANGGSYTEVIQGDMSDYAFGEIFAGCYTAQSDETKVTLVFYSDSTNPYIIQKTIQGYDPKIKIIDIDGNKMICQASHD